MLTRYSYCHSPCQQAVVEKDQPMPDLDSLMTAVMYTISREGGKEMLVSEVGVRKEM